ncbi:MAG: ribosome small subunit-dependent GTPase A [Solobacterium sp.]|nr:ribosome small subunit-dependent GTPase A [Solobacterium sp.]MBQ9823677.1 ribosome small subunit-dependent GTPase A [Solobacterium sp.]
MIARIVKIVSREYTLLMDNGERHKAILMGKVRRQDAPAAGDLVEAEFTDNRWVIQKILPRRNKLIRPYVANVDQAIIVMSVVDPDFSPALIDRLSILIEAAGITPLLAVTKCDLGIPEETEERIREYEKGPMRVIRTAKGSLDPSLASVLEGKISVLTGQSGAGKSTLLNELEPSFHLATQEISKALGRGKHTTRHNELHPVAGGLVADTPGFSSLDFSHITAQELGQDVIDFEPYIGKCRFNDCVHQNEPGCAVKQAVEEGRIPLIRWQNYLQVLEMIQTRREKYV